MKIEWKNFLENAGAEFADDKVESFGNPARERQIIHAGSTVCDLSHYGLIAAYGDDAVDFLQGQFTNDVAQVSDTSSQLSAYCSPKGRMLTNFRLFKRGETLYLSLPQPLLEPVLNRLRMFVMRSKVTLEDASDALMRFGLNGPEAEKQLEAITGKVPKEVNEVAQFDDYSIVRIHGTDPRFEIYGHLDASQHNSGNHSMSMPALSVPISGNYSTYRPASPSSPPKPLKPSCHKWRTWHCSMASTSKRAVIRDRKLLLVCTTSANSKNRCTVFQLKPMMHPRREIRFLLRILPREQVPGRLLVLS